MKRVLVLLSFFPLCRAGNDWAANTVRSSLEAAKYIGCTVPIDVTIPMIWDSMSSSQPVAIEFLQKSCSAIAETCVDNPKTTATVVGIGALTCGVYRGISYLSTIDIHKASSITMMGYCSLKMLSDIKKLLKDSLSTVEHEEIRIRSELKLDDFEVIQPEPKPDKPCFGMTARNKSIILLQLQENNIRTQKVVINSFPIGNN